MSATQTPHPGLGNLPIYLIVVETPLGVTELEIPSLSGPVLAAKRAWLTALQQGWGDIGEVVVMSAALIDPETNEPGPSQSMREAGPWGVNDS